MTSAKDHDAATVAGADGTTAVAALTTDNEDELDTANDEPEENPTRVDPLPQQSASPIDIDKGVRLIQLCRDGSVLAVKASVGEGSPAGFISKTGWTPLAAAAYSGKTEIVSYLLEIGADAMYKTSRRSATAGHMNAPDSSGSSGLLQHSSSGTKPSNESYYSSSSSSHTSSKPGCGVNTPLHWASYKGHLDVLVLLLHAGYSIEDVDPIGNRCLHLACSGGHREAVELLLANSASVDQRNVYGNRALDLATDASCRKLLLKFQSQTTCEWCKEAFTRIRRPSLCQHCHNVYCDARPCSSYLESSSSSLTTIGGTGRAAGVGGTSALRVMRFCQDCANEMGKAEQELRSLLESKLELIRHTLSVLGSKTDTANEAGKRAQTANAGSSAGSRPSSGLGHADGAESDAPGTGNDSEAASTDNHNSEPGGIDVVSGSGEDTLAASASSSESPTMSTEDTSPSGDDTSDEPLMSSSASLTAQSNESPGDASSSIGTARRRMVTNEEMARALTLSQTDAEALYTAIEAAQAKAADQQLTQLAKRTYHQLVAHVALQEEIKSLMVVRPIGVRSLVASLKSALRLAQRKRVSEPMLQLAIQVIQSAEAECTLFGCHALCAKIELGSKQHSCDIARLEASIAEAQQLGANDKLLAAASALRDRLNAEILLEDCLLPFTAKTSTVPETGAETTQYAFSDGSLAPSLLQALELRSQKITAAVEFGSSVNGVSPTLLEEGANTLKQLKKDIRDETKNEEERRRLEEEAAAKATKKGKKKKA